MSFGAPLGLLALLALPVVLWLHLYRRPPRERSVAGLFLFAQGPPPGAAGRRRQWLRRTASLLLELLAVLLLALLLAEPRRPGAAGSDHLLLVLDDTASMGAIGVDGRSSAERAREIARAALAGLSGAGQATLLLTGAAPSVLAGPRAPAGLARAALDRWQPAAPHDDAQAACALALDLAAAGDRILLLTDDASPEVPPWVEVLACGRPEANAAIARAVREPAAAEGGGETLLVDIAASGGTPRTTRLRLHDAAAAEAVPLVDVPVELMPGETSRLRVALSEALASRTLRLSLSQGGALALDDVARLPPQPPTAVSVADLLPAEVSRALAVERLLTAIPGLVRAADPATAQLLLTVAPGTPRAGRVELVIAATEGARQVFLGPFLSDRGAALLAGASFDGVLWPAGAGVLSGVPLVLAGDLPLLTLETGSLSLRLALNLDATGSSLARSPDWPIFISNVAELARSLRPGLARARVLVGEQIEWRGGAADGPLTLREPDGTERTLVVESRFTARQPGEHVLRREGAELARVQVDFVDLRESDLSACSQGRREARGGEVAAAGLHTAGIDPLWMRLLAGVLLLALAADWWVLRRGAAS